MTAVKCPCWILAPSVEISAGMERDVGHAGRVAASGILVEGPRLSAGMALAVREAWSALWTSRLVVWAAGVLGVLWFGSVPSGGLDSEGLTTPFSPFGDLLAAPAARWDSVWYLSIAQHGYGDSASPAKSVFYPLYPSLIHAGNWVLGSQLIAGVLISLGCFLGALVLLYLLAEIELGPRDARGTLLLVAFFPSAVFFSAIYTESLLLLL
jgi:hypothetical protein